MTSPAPSVELTVSVYWKHDLIAVRHLTGRASAAVGDLPGAVAPIPCEGIHGGGWVFARLDAGEARVSVPAGMMARRRSPTTSDVDLIEGPVDEPLAAGAAIEISIGAFVLRASAAAPDRLAAPIVPRAPRGALVHIGLAAAAHAIVFGFAVQDSMASDRDAEESAQRGELQQLLVAAEQRARALDVTVEQGFGTSAGGDVNHRLGDGRDGGGARASGDAGAMGDKSSRADEHRRYAVTEQVRHDQDIAPSREAAMQDAAAFGMIGVLASNPESPIAPWFGKDEARGADAIAASGEMWASVVGSEYAPGGLYLSGIGEGGGGRGEGIGLGTIGTLGHTWGRPGGGTGGGGAQLIGHGSRSGGSWDSIGVSHTHRVQRPRVWWGGGGYAWSGRLPPEIIQRIIRQNFGRFRACYQSALVHTPELAGTVTVRFVIGRDGAVSNVADGGSSMPDPAVTRCVVRAFYGLSFPQPEGGIVTVTYPIRFEPVT